MERPFDYFSNMRDPRVERTHTQAANSVSTDSEVKN